MSESGNGFVRKELFETIVGAIKEDLDEIKDSQKWVTRYFITVAIAFMAWMGVQLYQNIQVRGAAQATAAEHVIKPVGKK
jgi:small basic protein